MLRELGAAVVDADEASHAVYEPGTQGFAAVVAQFGDDYVSGGRIDRKRLGELVFRDADARRLLNAIVHPLVRDWMAARTVEAAGRGAKIVVQDVPLLFENGLQQLFTSVVLVYVPEEVQVERLVHGRGFTSERAREVIAAQMPAELKRARADYVTPRSACHRQQRHDRRDARARRSALGAPGRRLSVRQRPLF